jgi:hypothetical protein
MCRVQSYLVTDPEALSVSRMGDRTIYQTLWQSLLVCCKRKKTASGVSHFTDTESGRHFSLLGPYHRLVVFCVQPAGPQGWA